ncbi:lipoprotein [Listeria grandensis FSL F6-0971]|uniref:Lipoprotein n=1 Tax=Listeria grandensis FSL F6-0971 TaxID=1265819 RepID=W7BK13_9LIST|nr:lipoprotein [Listeria grandensis FSL F6-0971]
MKKIKWSVLAFLVLALLLSAGTSYLALEQNAAKKENGMQTKKKCPSRLSMKTSELGRMTARKLILVINLQRKF